MVKQWNTEVSPCAKRTQFGAMPNEPQVVGSHRFMEEWRRDMAGENEAKLGFFRTFISLQP